jgi:hypothetical protein
MAIKANNLNNYTNYIDALSTLKKYLELLLVFNIHIIPKLGQHLKQKYICFRKKKLQYLVNLKIKRDLIKIWIFRFNYADLISFWKITEGIKIFINHGSLIMTVSLNINPDMSIAWERIYQNYIYECQMLLIEVLKLAEKLATYLM